MAARPCWFESSRAHQEPLRAKLRKVVDKVGVINPNYSIKSAIASWVRDYLSCNSSNNRNWMRGWATLSPPYASVVQW